MFLSVFIIFALTSYLAQHRPFLRFPTRSVIAILSPYVSPYHDVIRISPRILIFELNEFEAFPHCQMNYSNVVESVHLDVVSFLLFERKFEDYALKDFNLPID